MITKNIVLGVCVCGMFGTAFAFADSLSTADKNFMKVAAETTMTEAHKGQMAENQASAQDVKDFGQKIAQDSSNAYSQLLNVATKTGESVPRGIDVRHNPDIGQLSHLKGTQFDRHFAQAEIRDYQRTIAEFKREAEHGQDSDVKAYASNTLPVLQADLQKAQELAKTEMAKR